MIKSAAYVTGFATAASVLYHLAFWSFFDIDIFQYLAVSDIIKGAAYSIRFSFLYVAPFLLYLGSGIAFVIQRKAFAQNLISAEIAKSEIRTLFALFIIAQLLFIVFILFLSDDILSGLVVSIFFTYLVAQVIILISLNISRLLSTDNGREPSEKDKNTIKLVKAYASVGEAMLLVFFLINSVITGRVDARAISSGKHYDYILMQDLPANLINTKKNHLIYLGAISEKYIFMESPFEKKIIIDKSALPVISICHYEADNTFLVSQFDSLIAHRVNTPLDKVIK
jgi:hypothetical protein